MKTLKRFVTMMLVFASLLGGIYVFQPNLFKGRADASVTATPTSQLIQAVAYNNGSTTNVSDISESIIPLYSIIQDNGWGANYVKLRDIAFYMDFAVNWDASKPNEMRIYTNRHYLEPLNSTGPATETKIAAKSTMDMYIDDIKVDVDAYIIDNNNFFKIRDLAKAVGFGCGYFPADKKFPERVIIHAQYPYQDGDLAFNTQNYPTKRIINYEEFTPWFDASSGMHNEPVVNRRDNPWARMDYYAKYGAEVGDLGISERFSDPSVFNAVMQLLIDWNEIRKDQSGGWVEGNFVEGLNPNYMYPICSIPYGNVEFGVHIWGRQFAGIALEPRPKDDGETMYMLTPILNETSERIGTVGHAGYSVTIQKIREQAKTIYQHMNTLNSDREKITYLANEVCKRITYQDGYERNLPNVSETLRNGSFWNAETQCGGVCTDYAEAFTIISVPAGYEVIQLSGHDHAWNLVYLKDENAWVVVDCTWADTSRNSKYICMDLNDYDYDSQNSGLRLLNAAYTAKSIGE